MVCRTATGSSRSRPRSAECAMGADGGDDPPREEDPDRRAEGTDHDPAEDVRDVVDVCGHPGQPQSQRESQQGGAPPASHRQDHHGDRGGQRRVVRGEPVVGRMGDQGRASVDDEGTRVDPDRTGDLDRDEDCHGGDDRGERELQLALAWGEEPGADGAQRHGIQGIVGNANDDGLDENRGKVKVMVSMFGRETPVELDFLQIRKL